MLDSPLKILLVDDTPEDRETVRRYLTRNTEEQWVVLEAETASDALDLWRREQPDAILLDFHLPDMTGLELLYEMMKAAGERPVPVVMLTGTGSEQIAVEAMKNGAQDYLVKGRVTPEAMRRSVQRAVERVRMLRQVEDQRQELEEKNRRLQQADARKDEFLAMLAHELRNPLAASQNAVELLKMTRSDQQRLNRALQVLERQLRHQNRLLDDLLDVSRITRGKILLRLEWLDLRDVVRDAVQDHRGSLEQIGIRLELDLPDEPVCMLGDRVRLGQVLGNLLHNARKFTDPGGEVCVTLRVGKDEAHREEAVLSVQDTGVGINPDMLPRLFEYFAQADRTLDRSGGGLGLGLALVRGLAVLHGGRVEAESAGPGKGAEFRVVLPLGGQKSEAVSPAPVVGEAQEPLRILLIEDNADAADTLKDLLELSGHVVDVAYTGTAGLEAAQRIRPDIVLCDIGLPGMDGYQVAAALRADPALAGLRLVAVSGYGQEDDRQRSHAAGFDLHLTKPVEPRLLERILGGANL